MTADRSESASRYFDFRLAIGIPLGLMALLLLLDPSGVDFALAELFYEPGQGFIVVTASGWKTYLLLLTEN
ncbi:hypothetical protein [Pseudomonas sp. GWSMS-1]|uniref:hypothetical protein n=1 Tax=Pseudomonas sp. GWSMS-1 TaxID=3308997 RepID=UPI003CE9268E